MSDPEYLTSIAPKANIWLTEIERGDLKTYQRRNLSYIKSLKLSTKTETMAKVSVQNDREA